MLRHADRTFPCGTGCNGYSRIRIFTNTIIDDIDSITTNYVIFYFDEYCCIC